MPAGRSLAGTFAPTWKMLLAGLLAVGFAAPLIWQSNNYQLYVLALVALTAVVGTGLNVLIGLAGQFSLGHVAFYGIGAYTVGLLTTKAGSSFWLAWPLAGLIAGLAGMLLAIPALAVRGPYLAMVTIAFGFIFEQSVAEFGTLTGGWNGLTGIPTPSIGSRSFGERETAVFALCSMLVVFWLYARLSASPWGRAMRAVRDGEVASQSIGLDPRQIRTAAFALSAAAAGLAGGVFAAMSDFISPESFPFFQSILFILVVMIGGTGHLWGPLFGALVIVLLPELLSWLAQYRLLFVGLLMLVILRLAPEGVAGLLQRFRPARAPGPGPRSLVDVAGGLAASGPRPELCVRDLAISFGGVQAVCDVSFKAVPGRITSVIGPNGAGKSTMLNLICGFYSPDRGEVSLGWQKISGLSSHHVARAGIARTFQTTQLFANMSVLENVRVAMQRGKLPMWQMFSPDHATAEIERAESLLAFAGYDGPIDRPAGALAHVDKRIVEIARALALSPSVLALDEPAAGLDASDKQRLGSLLRRIAERGIAVILVEHDMTLVMAVSDHVVVLDAGRKIAEGPPRSVARDPVVLEAYLGQSGESAVRQRKVPRGVLPGTRLQATDLASGYGPIKVIQDVGIEVGEGELVAILGANGAGKTTLMRALAGLNRPVGGEVRLMDMRVDRLGPDRIARLGLALVPEGRQVFPELSVIDNLKLGAYARPVADLDARAEALLQRFPRLGERRQQRAGLLSGGEQQMLAIARGLIGSPVVLMLDEPSLGLAPALVEGLYDLLRDLRDEGTTIVLVDQMAALALSVADRGYVLQSGRIVSTGAAGELRADPALTEAYIGRTDANV